MILSENGAKKTAFSTFFAIFFRPIPAKAGISAAAKRREIVPPSATVCAYGEEIPAFAGMELKRFRLSPEWRILIKRLKVPPFRRKFILANAGTGISF
ncbi:MAG: hypothetical protein ACR2QC_00980, partial [Gammaproteobacteria bacterium]